MTYFDVHMRVLYLLSSISIGKCQRRFLLPYFEPQVFDDAQTAGLICSAAAARRISARTRTPSHFGWLSAARFCILALSGANPRSSLAQQRFPSTLTYLTTRKQ